MSSRRSTRRESSFEFVPVAKRGNVANTRARSSGSDDQHRVIAALGLGNPHEGQGARLAAFGKAPVGQLIADETTGIVLLSENELQGRPDKDLAIRSLSSSRGAR